MKGSTGMSFCKVGLTIATVWQSQLCSFVYKEEHCLLQKKPNQ